MQFCLKSGEDYPARFKTGGSIPLIPPSTTPLLFAFLSVSEKQKANSLSVACVYHHHSSLFALAVDHTHDVCTCRMCACLFSATPACRLTTCQATSQLSCLTACFIDVVRPVIDETDRDTRRAGVSTGGGGSGAPQERF